jgi:hypothetical protein
MDQNARIAALEYLVAYLLRERRDRDGKQIDQALDKLSDSMFGSDGPGNPHTKLAAAEALKNIRQLI